MSCTVLRSSATWGVLPHRMQSLHGCSRPRAHWPPARGVNLNESPKTIIPLALGRASESRTAMTGGILGLAGCAKCCGRVECRVKSPPTRFKYLVCKFGGAFPWAAWDDSTADGGMIDTLGGNFSARRHRPRPAKHQHRGKRFGLDDVELKHLPASLPPPPHPEEEACHAGRRSNSRRGLVRPSRPFLGWRCQIFGIAWGAGPRVSERWG